MWWKRRAEATPTAMAAPPMSFAAYAVRGLSSEKFFLVDLGCAGGIAPAWRVFGDRLGALALDASVDECRRLASAEANPAVEYLAAFAGISSSHPFSQRRHGREEASRNPWGRLSAARTAAQREAWLRGASDAQKIRESLWYLTETSEKNQVIVPQLLCERGVTSVDFLKIDTDGNDFAILNSFDGAFDGLGILGALVEVNFGGGPDDTNRTFHNTDRFMKAQGFELFDLTQRRYSAAALPARYELGIAAQTGSGRILQGDALYVRDWAAPYWEKPAAAASPDKLLKLAIVFATFALLDCAAEILVRFRERLAGQIDVDRGLDLLAAEMQAGVEKPLSYRDYIAAFEADSPLFYPDGTKR